MCCLQLFTKSTCILKTQHRAGLGKSSSVQSWKTEYKLLKASSKSRKLSEAKEWWPTLTSINKWEVRTYCVPDLQAFTLPLTRVRYTVLAGSSEKEIDILRLIPDGQLHFRPDALNRERRWSQNHLVKAAAKMFSTLVLWCPHGFL